MLKHLRFLIVAVTLSLASACTQDADRNASSQNEVPPPSTSTGDADDTIVVAGEILYTRSSEKNNQEAGEFLRSMLADSDLREELLDGSSKVIICGPGLWHQIKEVAPDELKGAMKATFVIPYSSTKEPQVLEGRVFKTDEQRIAFWNLFQTLIDVSRLKMERDQTPVIIRKANEEELAYYWSTIPYESIEEPLFIVILGDMKYLFDFMEEDGMQKVFTVDIVLESSEPDEE